MENPERTDQPAAPEDDAAHLLVVDDDFNARAGTAHTLADYFPQAGVHEAGSLAEAIDRLQAIDVSVVLLDLNLGDSRGIATLVALKSWCARHDCNPRLVVVSGAADMDDQLIVQAIDQCATGFIAKGTHPSVFKSAIDMTVDGVETGVAGGAGKPVAVDAGIGIENRVEGPIPVDGLRRFGPEGIRIVSPAFIDRVIA